MDIPTDVDAESDRIFFIKAVAQFMVTSNFSLYRIFSLFIDIVGLLYGSLSKPLPCMIAGNKSSY